MKRRLLAPAVACLAAAAIIALLVFGVAQKAPNATLDDAIQSGQHPVAPAASRVLKGLGSQPSRSLASLRGHVVVLNFWASWCDACVGETQTLERAQKMLASHGGTVLGATYQDVPSDSAAFLRKHHLTYPNVVDSDIKLATAYGTRALPETFVIDRSGRIVAMSRGALRAGQLDRWIQQALAA
jgi:cytochrome c biogenesis protein CcmG/thiol:disulfide interchange protein DsbE